MSSLKELIKLNIKLKDDNLYLKNKILLLIEKNKIMTLDEYEEYINVCNICYPKIYPKLPDSPEESDLDSAEESD
jgi:hypothetical protein